MNTELVLVHPGRVLHQGSAWVPQALELWIEASINRVQWKMPRRLDAGCVPEPRILISSDLPAGEGRQVWLASG